MLKSVLARRYDHQWRAGMIIRLPRSLNGEWTKVWPIQIFPSINITFFKQRTPNKVSITKIRNIQCSVWEKQAKNNIWGQIWTPQLAIGQILDNPDFSQHLGGKISPLRPPEQISMACNSLQIKVRSLISGASMGALLHHFSSQKGLIWAILGQSRTLRVLESVSRFLSGKSFSPFFLRPKSQSSRINAVNSVVLFRGGKFEQRFIRSEKSFSITEMAEY